MSDSSTAKITLVSEDKLNILVSKDAILSRSIVLRDMLEDLGEASNDVPIPISTVKGEILQKVVEWCEYHHQHIIPTPQEFQGKTSPWDEEFFRDQPDDFVFDIILAANFLELKDLLELGVKIIATAMLGLTDSQIRERFDLVDDLTPEEKKQIRAEHYWA